MTDNEIIKVLERCSDGTGKGIIKATLDLIKRKDEQIEALIAGQETLQKALNKKIEEVEKITEVYSNLIIEKDELFEEAERLIKQAKSEAVKEFAERLCEGRVSNDPVVIAVKAELKEMVGEG